ncbi:hypothetical protein [Gluconobacter japonicus]|uniref:hypothetical protein n=1 Tax=Gluconobacter japonicus TaxID=376620 RepID=UPI00078416FB|nr:hypothetical protein [Gluconobacter japonicus]KXV22468.1 hypothetical protein AD935_03870 [Gluconobacter japonicus]
MKRLLLAALLLPSIASANPTDSSGHDEAHSAAEILQQADATQNLQTVLAKDPSVKNSLRNTLLYGGDPTGKIRLTPSIQCPGNGDFGTAYSYGLFCFNADTNPASQTYVGQISVNNITPETRKTFTWTVVKPSSAGSSSVDVTPAFTMVSGYTYTITGDGIPNGTRIIAASQDPGGKSTTAKLSLALTKNISPGTSLNGAGYNGKGSLDPVGLYVGITNNAHTTEGWAGNFLVNDRQDGGGTGSGVIEVDQNNFNCDNPDPGGVYYVGSRNPKKTRSDGSNCPGHSGLGITGLTGYTSGTALSISGVPHQTTPMWATGITMIGGYVIGSSELWTETLAHTMWTMRGSHMFALEAHNAHFGYAFANLPKDPVSGRIAWACADKSTICDNSVNPIIAPTLDGSLTFSGKTVVSRGTDSYHAGGLGIDFKSPSGNTVKSGNDWSWLTWASGGYSFYITDTKTLYKPMRITSDRVVLGSGLVLPQKTKRQILNVQNPVEGMLLNNSEDHMPVIYENGHWYPIQLGKALQ